MTLQMITQDKTGCIKGNLELQSSACILLTVFLHRFSGRLEIFQDDEKKSLFFENGNITFAASNIPDDRLGDILLSENKISQRQYDESVEELKKGKKRQGSILVQRGYLSMHELIHAIRHQIKKILFSIFLWKKGQFIFYLTEKPIKESVTLRENTLRLLKTYINEGAFDEEWLTQGISSVRSIFYYNTNMEEDLLNLSLTPYEMKICQFLSEEEKTLEQLCDWSDLEPIDTVKSFHFLIEKKLVCAKNDIWDNPQSY